jgi:hypothetical protein
MKWPPENQNPRTDGNQARTSKNGFGLRHAEHALSIKKPGRQQEPSSPVEIDGRRASTAREAKLWERVQKAHAATRANRAADDPAFAKAFAEWDRYADAPGRAGQVTDNVLPFQKATARRVSK